MSLGSCELNNNFNEVAACLNARLNRAYILPLPSVCALALTKKKKTLVFREEYKITVRFANSDTEFKTTLIVILACAILTFQLFAYITIDFTYA